MAEKELQELFEEMFSEFTERTGRELARESDLGVRLYVFASQLRALYMQAEWTRKQCFPQTATGENLEHHAEMRGLSRRGGVPASGMVRFYAEAGAEDLEIPAGTALLGPNLLRFLTGEAAVIRAGEEHCDVAAGSEEGGSAYNVASGEIAAMALPVVGVRAVSNLSAFAGGTDAEDDEALRARVLETYKRLPNGANAVFYETEAMKIEGVEQATAVGRARGRGTVDLYISSYGGEPSEELIREVYEALNEKREIAVDLLVKAPGKTPFALAMQVRPKPGADFSLLKLQVEAEVRARFTGAMLSKPVYIAWLHSLILGIAGVENVKILSPAVDIEAVAGALPSLSAVTITEMA